MTRKFHFFYSIVSVLVVSFFYLYWAEGSDLTSREGKKVINRMPAAEVTDGGINVDSSLQDDTCSAYICQRRKETRGEVLCPNQITQSSGGVVGYQGNCGEPYGLHKFCSSDFQFIAKVPPQERWRPEQPYDPTGCELLVSNKFANHLRNQLKPCIEQAAERVGWGKTSSIQVTHYDCMIKRAARGSRSISSHTTGRGFDITDIHLKTSQGPKSIKMLKPGKGKHRHHNFIGELRRCWHNFDNCNRSIGYRGAPSGCTRRSHGKGKRCRRGSKDYATNNKIHDDHLHFSNTCNTRGKNLSKHRGRHHANF